MPNIEDARSAFLEAKAEVEEFWEKFILDWYEPDINLAVSDWYRRLSPQEKELVRRAAPDAVKALEDKMGGKR